MRIADLFDSVQGEGKLAGVPSAFIRSSGCNLRCGWCDTPYASWRPEGLQQIAADVVVWAIDTGRRHAVFTGGEPVIQPDAADLCDGLADAGLHVTLETSGTVFKPLAVSLLSLSPKLAHSTPRGTPHAEQHEATRLDFGVMNRLITHTRGRGGDVQVKFVVIGEADLAEVEAVVAQLDGLAPDDVLLMPEGRDLATLGARSAWVVEACKTRNWRFCPRMHVYLYGDRRGT